MTHEGLLTPMHRVLIIGISGAGKSTFAAALAARTGLPLISLVPTITNPWHA